MLVLNLSKQYILQLLKVMSILGYTFRHCHKRFVEYTHKTIEGYFDSVSPVTFNTIKAKLKIHAVHSFRYLQSKLMSDLSHASMVKIQYSSKLFNPLY